MKKGDKIAYQELYIYYAENLKHGEILLYSLEMAHKYNYPQAYDNIYCTLVERENSNNLDSLDEQTRGMAIYYLLKAHELGIDETILINDLFGHITKIPKSNEYCNFKKLSVSMPLKKP